MYMHLSSHPTWEPLAHDHDHQEIISIMTVIMVMVGKMLEGECRNYKRSDELSDNCDISVKNVNTNGKASKWRQA